MDISEWIEHRRGDGERIGWMRHAGEGFVAVDLLGRDVTASVEWAEAEEALEALGIGYLADAYLLDRDDGPAQRVRIVEVTTDAIVVKNEDYGDMTAPQVRHRLDWPIPPELSPKS